jgi:hypothetical protein
MACLVLGAPIGLAGAAVLGRGPELMSGLFVGYTGLGWPRGVQEEDPSGGWNWRLPAPDDRSSGLPQADDAAIREGAIAQPAIGAMVAWTIGDEPVPEISEDASPVEILLPTIATIRPGTSRARTH